ncbi:hypothetical protein T265_15202 [Opisthorchis viverrini]|uniref:Dynein light chain n=1 Tax=Opisthorchis viverrini TaxID=6198 RepID=A0A075A0I5_OPIVI|nr:hypothetical protein T265_15202 [Opisthorchis viverrini]KER20934.1 hypothetical protein T265_15202 [Opisthorchis viverrini]
MVDRLAKIKCVEMPIEMQEEAVRTANEALDTYSEDYEIAAYLRQRFDKLYKPVWHCFVGRSFGGYSEPPLTWQRSMKEITKRLDAVGATRLQDEDRVILNGWRYYKIWLPTDVSGVLVVSFSPDHLIECLEAWAPRNDCVDLELADDIVLICEEEKAQVFLDELTKVITSSGIRFAPTKVKVILVDMQSLNTQPTIQGEALEFVERFTYLGSCSSSDCSVTDEVCDNFRPRTIDRVGCCRRIRNEAVRKRVFGCATGTSIEECVQHRKLRWLVRVLCKPSHYLPRRVLFPMPGSEWRKQRVGQPLAWQGDMKEITKRLGAVGATRLPGWGPRNPRCLKLETLQDMTANRCQWRSC